MSDHHGKDLSVSCTGVLQWWRFSSGESLRYRGTYYWGKPHYCYRPVTRSC